MEEDEPNELKKATGQKMTFSGPTEDEEDATQLTEYYLKIKNDKLFGFIVLDPRLYELTPVDDD
jgi:hypothetical protein